jgi:hypothetical protein
VACTPCPNNTQTAAGVRGATSRDACLAPPGYGWNATDGAAAVCDYGYFNPGWNRQPCAKCGEGSITTAGRASTSPGACYTPAGHGTRRSSDGLVLTGFPCPVGTYGSERATYGLGDVACTKCIEYTSTNSTGATSALQCTTLPGFGWNNGGSELCDFAYWSSGGSQEPCRYCGEGYNTTAGADYVVAAQGADSLEHCAVAAGWTSDGAGGIKPCLQGFYKSLLGPSDCVQCPNGTTTTETFAPSSLADCDACRSGFGAASVSASTPACTICGSGTYSFGHVSGGQACQPCPKPDGYGGAMVSRRVRGAWAGIGGDCHPGVCACSLGRLAARMQTFARAARGCPKGGRSLPREPKSMRPPSLQKTGHPLPRRLLPRIWHRRRHQLPAL